MTMMWMPTAIAISGSRIAHCGIAITTSSPPMIPTEVQTSVRRCFASASIVMLSCCRATFSMMRAVDEVRRAGQERDDDAGPEARERLRDRSGGGPPTR